MDGPITKNIHIMNLVASMRKNQQTFKNKKEIGTGLGASILFNINKKNSLNISRIRPTKKYNLIAFYQMWLKEIGKRNLFKIAD